MRNVRRGNRFAVIALGTLLATIAMPAAARHGGDVENGFILLGTGREWIDFNDGTNARFFAPPDAIGFNVSWQSVHGVLHYLFAPQCNSAPCAGHDVYLFASYGAVLVLFELQWTFAGDPQVRFDSSPRTTCEAKWCETGPLPPPPTTHLL